MQLQTLCLHRSYIYWGDSSFFAPVASDDIQSHCSGLVLEWVNLFRAISSTEKRHKASFWFCSGCSIVNMQYQQVLNIFSSFVLASKSYCESAVPTLCQDWILALFLCQQSLHFSFSLNFCSLAVSWVTALSYTEKNLPVIVPMFPVYLLKRAPSKILFKLVLYFS